MDLQINEEIQAINSELARALTFEDKFAKFSALGDVAVLTSSNQLIPAILKARILKRIEEEQQQIAYCCYEYPSEQEDIDEDLRHENPVAVK